MQWVGILSNKHDISLPLSIYILNSLRIVVVVSILLHFWPLSGIICGLILHLCPRQCGAARICEM